MENVTTQKRHVDQNALNEIIAWVFFIAAFLFGSSMLVYAHFGMVIPS